MLSLTFKCQRARSATVRRELAHQTERPDLTRGDGPYAGPANRAGFRLPAYSPIRAIARVPLSNPAAALPGWFP